MPQELKETDLVSACFTMHMPQPINASLLLVGTKDGSLVAYNPIAFEFLNNGNKTFVIEGQIGCISVKNSSVVLATSKG